MEWKIPYSAPEISEAFLNSEFTPLLAAVLQARGADTPEKARKYLTRDEFLLCDPLLLTDMDKAVTRIGLALEKKQKLAVYGDYDVDGITSVCLLLDYFSGRGLECEAYIPDRLDEGYGVNSKALKVLRDRGVDLVITVDCGITATAETEYAKSLGLDIIITDHHECPQTLPCAEAVINPKRPDSKYPFPELAGVSVAFKLVCALEGNSASPLERYADLVALGTIADVMPLIGENRALVYRGLEKLKTDPLPGLAALLEEAGAANKAISANTVGFTLAPRINAAGRLCKTEASIKLLLSKNRTDAEAPAKELCALNRRRQELETEVWEEAMSVLSADEPEGPIVLGSDSWHPGVVGIAASRLSEEYRLPTIMICFDNGIGKGSCRSYGDFNLFEALTACSEHLESFGGHAMAAGLNIKPEKIEGFRKALGEYYLSNLPTEHADLKPEVLICDPSLLSMEGVRSLSELEPCGSGNEHPRMCMCGAVLESVSPIGNGKHLKIRISKKGTVFDCVFFSRSAENLGANEKDLVDICFTPQINEFHFRQSVQLLICDLHSSETPDNCQRILENAELKQDKIMRFRPDREELGSLWRRIIASGGRFVMQSERLCEGRFGFDEPERLCLCLRIFHELGLVELKRENGGLICTSVKTNEKTELNQSPLYRQLWGNDGLRPSASE